MKEVIKLLLDDHKKIEEKICDTKRLMTLAPENSFGELAQNLNFFKEFTFGGHHARENEILYMWMERQNPNSDTTIMNRIKDEHRQLEELGNKIHSAINNYLKKTPKASNVTILSDLNDFVVLYREHIEKEEKFIFMIAQGLKLTETEQESMLKKMRQTL